MLCGYGEFGRESGGVGERKSEPKDGWRGVTGVELGLCVIVQIFAMEVEVGVGMTGVVVVVAVVVGVEVGEERELERGSKDKVLVVVVEEEEAGRETMRCNFKL